MEFVSERLRLIPFTESRLNEEVLSWFNMEDLMKYYTNSKNRITKEGLLSSINDGIKNETSFTYFIENKNNSNIIGTIKIGPINKAHKISDLVALIGKNDNLGKGVGTEAIRLGIRLAFEKYDIRKLFGGMYSNNIASIKAYTRAGWVVEGLLKGHYLENNHNQDRILVGCFNPRYFTQEEINQAKLKAWYENQ